MLNTGKKIKTFKDKNPLGTTIERTVIDKFINDTETMLSLLETSKSVDLSSNRIPISIAPWLKIRLGDTLRFLTYHTDRHLLQVERLMK